MFAPSHCVILIISASDDQVHLRLHTPISRFSIQNSRIIYGQEASKTHDDILNTSIFGITANCRYRLFAARDGTSISRAVCKLWDGRNNAVCWFWMRQSTSLEILSVVSTVTATARNDTGQIIRPIAAPWDNERSSFEQPIYSRPPC